MSRESKENSRYRNFIGGEWLPPASGAYYEVHNPAEAGELVGVFPRSDTADAGAAVEAAHRAFPLWKQQAPSARADLVYRLSELLESHKEELADAAVREQGKLYREALNEAVRGVKELRILAGEALRLEGIFRPSDSPRTVNTAERVPIGVVAAITPWNFPILTPLRKTVPALVAGCTVVLKPASDTPLSCVILAELAQEAGFPPGTFNLVIGRGGEVGDALTADPRVKGVTFTGSTAVGRKISSAAAPNFTRLQLEMGGKNAAVVCRYGDLEKAAGKIVGAAFTNAGQRCTAVSRVIVLEEQADELEERILEAARKIRVGPGFDETVQMGPLVNSAALETVEGYVRSAVKEGASVRLGGERLTGGLYDRGCYYPPTVITGVTPGMKVAREEIFGPVLSILRVSSREQAVEVCNATEYGLTATVYSDDMDFTHDFTREAEVGMIRVNNLGVSGGNMPFGGVKNSGQGAFSIGSTTMDFYTTWKVVYIEY